MVMLKISSHMVHSKKELNFNLKTVTAASTCKSCWFLRILEIPL
jgi:hypothetical protein